MKKGRFDHINVEIIDILSSLTRFVCLEDTSVRTTKDASLTNQAEDVIDWLNHNRKFYGDGYNVHYLYKDTNGVVDELLINEKDGKFSGFRILGADGFQDGARFALEKNTTIGKNNE